MKYVVIGAVAGGPSFATRLRRLDENAEILMLERGENISYASCALPYYLGGVITDRASLIERTPQILKEKNNIEVRTLHEVLDIDPAEKKLKIRNLSTNEEYFETYDQLIISSGASPVLPNIKGAAEAANGFVLRSVTDADKIKTFLDRVQPKHVTIIDRLPEVAFPYDSEIADIIYQHLLDKNVHVILNETITEIEDNGRTITLADGSRFETDMILFATGVAPNNELAKAAGITLSNGQIVVNEKLETNIKDIYAIGDVIETKSYITGLPINSVLSSAANRQGHLLADILAGNPLTYRGFIGAGVGKIFDLTASFVGYTEHMLKAAGITNYKTVFITPFDHAYFYPGATRLNLKIIFEEETGKILGGQAVGEKGVDKRIGELSAAITGKLTVYDLPDLELPYSPPYSTTRDPLNTAGYVAINRLNSIVETVKADAIPAEDLKDAFFLDIREADKPESGTIPATLNIPLSELRERTDEVPKDRPVYITFRKGLNPYNAARILAGSGIKAVLIEE